MADHGTITTLLQPDPETFVLSDTFLPTAKSIDWSTVQLDPLDPTKLTTGTYSIAGTVDNSYRAPTVGQLWPRGDLDAP